MELAVQHASCRHDVVEIIQHMDKLLQRVEAHFVGPAHEAASRNIETTFSTIRDNCLNVHARLDKQELVVAVLALTKSGKSTLLNALIGASCLPANNVPETARIVRITHTPGTAELVDSSHPEPKVITGEEDIKTYLRYLNTETRSRAHSHSDETLLDLRIPVTAFDRCVQGAAPEVAVRLLDTPGPNEAGETVLKAQVERLLDSVDAVIYVLDYTKLKTADEAEVLCRLREINPQLMDRLSQRLFFVVNKADMIETSEGMDAAATKQYVADLITQQMHIEGFQLKQEQVLLLSAQQALLSRLVLEDKADQDSLSRFGRLAFGSRAHRYSHSDYLEAAEEMQIDSGLAALEETVLGFLYAHSGNLKLLALLDDTVRMLQQVRNVTATSNAALQRDVSALQAESEQMQGQLGNTLASFDKVQQDAQAVEGEVVDEVQQRMQRLKEKLFQEVAAALEPSRQPGAGRWQGPWLLASRLLRHRHHQRHCRDLQARLHELHAAISSSIEAEVQDFWKDVEMATNERQRSMFQCINQHLETLSRQIEATVGSVLDVRLEPVAICMDPPAAQDFHESLQNLFTIGIRSRSEQRSRQRSHNYTVWEPRFRNGLCRTGQYFVGRPACRNVTEQYHEPIYDLQADNIKEYFIRLVDATVESSVKYVREYVHAYLSDTLSEARGRIQEYADSFSNTMQAALATRQQGEQARSEALATVQAQLETTDSLLADVAAAQSRIQACLPHTAHPDHADLPQSSSAAAAASHNTQAADFSSSSASPVHPSAHDQDTSPSEGSIPESGEPVVQSVQGRGSASPLRAMMQELHDAMTANDAPAEAGHEDAAPHSPAATEATPSASPSFPPAGLNATAVNATSAGPKAAATSVEAPVAAAGPAAGISPAAAVLQAADLDEQAQLDLAILLSLEEAKAAESAAKARGVASLPQASSAPESSRAAAERNTVFSPTEGVAPYTLHTVQRKADGLTTAPASSLIDTANDPAVTWPSHEAESWQAAQAEQPAAGHMLQSVGSAHSDLSSAGPPRSPFATDSEPDNWQFLKNSAPGPAQESDSSSSVTLEGVAAGTDVPAHAVPIGQALVHSLHTLSAADDLDSDAAAGASSGADGAASVAVAIDQFAALSLVDTLGGNVGTQDSHLQLETEDSQFLDYCLDPNNAILPEGPHFADVVNSNPASSSHGNEQHLTPDLPSTSSSIAEGLCGPNTDFLGHPHTFSPATELHADLPLSSSPQAESLPITGQTAPWGSHATTLRNTSNSMGQSEGASALSPRSQLHAAVLGDEDVTDRPAFEDWSEGQGGSVNNGPCQLAEGDVPASIHCHHEHEEGEQDGGALEHEDSSEWSFVDGDVNNFELP